jgi:DNA primase
MKEYDLRKLLDRLDISVSDKNPSGWLVACCPFAEFLHAKGTDRKPSFYAKANSDGPSGFHCFTCKQHGSIRALVNQLAYYRDADYNHLALQATMLEVPDRFSDFEQNDDASYLDALPEPINALVYLSMYPSAVEFADAIIYLSSRGISEKTAEKLQLRFDPEAKRILFPVYDHSHLLYGFTGRSIIPDDARDPKSPKVKNYVGLKKEYRLLGEHLIDDEKPLLVVEGLFALAHLIELGVCNVCNPVAIMGSHLSDAQRDLIIGYDRPVYLCLDDDPAGTQGLYGAWDKTSNSYLGGGAVDKLKQHVPTMVCLYPERTGEVDELTYDEVKRMIEKDFEHC